ncbi:5-oxoprolinase subunit PxpB [uncultured Croceitalea sp.]|uniref:5-oxoprolinase subunit PxpB n=1 Tax=uncultured Croceitalea sp. TaxID=1798908 RepID=UPI003305D478
MKRFPINIKPFGEQAILIEWPNIVSEAVLSDILSFKNQLKEHLSQGFELIPAYNSLTLISNRQVDFEVLHGQLKSWYEISDGIQPAENFLWKLPVCYDLEFGIDLEEVSSQLQMTVAELIEQHTAHEYTVFGIGFLPGFMYLGGLPDTLETRRKAEPRLHVDKGSVGLAGKQTGIYPQDSPGGWNIIGNCPIPIFNVEAKTPCFVSVGDKIRFQAISKAKYDLHKIEGEVGIYQPEKIVLDA